MPNKKVKEVYKPYVPGKVFTGAVIRRGLKLLFYQILFVVFFLLGGGVISGRVAVLRYIVTVAVELVCGGLIWMEGEKDGISDLTAGQNAYNRKEAGKTIPESELKKCYHPMRSVVTFLVAVLPLVLVSGLYACIAVKEEIALPLQGFARDSIASTAGEGLGYYVKTDPMGLTEVLRVIVRICIFPFVNLADTNAKGAKLLIDRLSPLLICVPFISYIPAYLLARKVKALTHGQIAANEKKAARRKARLEAQKREREEKNRLI